MKISVYGLGGYRSKSCEAEAAVVARDHLFTFVVVTNEGNRADFTRSGVF